jgi:hypothetical protein
MERKNRIKGNREKTVNGRGKIKWHKKGNGNGGKYKKEKRDTVRMFIEVESILCKHLQQDPDCTQPDNPSDIRY